MNVTIRNGECRHVKIHHYPDGQKNVALDMEWFNNPKEPIAILCNIRDFDDLELLLCIVAALRKEDFFISRIDYKYLFGLRSDRSFERGMPNYARDVLCPILDNLSIPQKRILMPHNFAITNAAYDFYPPLTGCTVIGADESAINRNTFPICNKFFHKTREDGKIKVSLRQEFYSCLEDSPDYFPILIVDDLCDGGATFISIAEYLMEHFPDRKRHLYVCHGLFTKGVDHVAAHYDKIITTNSYQNFDAHPKLEVIDVWNN